MFCCFNNNYKITPADVRRLDAAAARRSPGSVLWLLRDNDGAEAQPAREATGARRRSGAAGLRGRAPLAEHLARHRLADLFLDTLPYNAHTTASDALWAGLPVLTCQGNAFAGARRVRACCTRSGCPSW